MKMFSPSTIIIETENSSGTYPLSKEEEVIKKYPTFPFIVVYEFWVGSLPQQMALT